MGQTLDIRCSPDITTEGRRMSGRKYSLSSDSDVKFPWLKFVCVVKVIDSTLSLKVREEIFRIQA